MTQNFDTPRVRARGPRSSQLTLDSIGRDESLKRNILRAVMALSCRHDVGVFAGDPDAVHDYLRPVTDDDITYWLEKRLHRRFQRNVVARTRGLLQQAGWFTPVPPVHRPPDHRPILAVIPSQMLLDLSDE